jgi:tetratricopeptide (TPR) repeat protein
MVRVLVAFGLSTSWLVGAALAQASDAEPVDLRGYMRQLETLVDRWSVAATAADLGMTELARSALADTSGAPGAPYWRSTQQFLERDFPRPEAGAAAPKPPDPAWYDAAGRPDLAAKAYAARAAVEQPDWADQWAWARCLYESGRPAEAHPLLSEIKLPEDETYYAEQLAEVVQKLKARPGVSLGRAWRNFFPFGPEGPHGELPRIVAKWRAISTPEDAVAFSEEFCLPEDLLGKRLALLWLADYPGVPRETAAQALVDAAGLLVPDRDAEAARVYRRVEEQFPDTQGWDLAVHGLGMTRKRAGDLDGAIAEFDRLFTGGLRGRQEMEPDGEPIVLIRHSKGQSHAMRALADCYYEQGRYAEALRAYRQHREHRPYTMGCGMLSAQMGQDHAFHVALCLEQLGRHGEAVVEYARAAVSFDIDAEAAGRLVALYEAAGQLDDLRRMLRDPENGYLLAIVKPALEGSRDAADEGPEKVAPRREWPRIPPHVFLPKDFSEELMRSRRRD